ncbi:MAG: tetratricopeptide repeat protein [Rhodocyclaceae bacterium]|jgi:tetratricopeptide (TPR) repeat protein|nr:tetratricopeptide repeat protein [Rhodocyclaceae bacterium]
MTRFAVLPRCLRATSPVRAWVVALSLMACGVAGTAAADSLGDASRLFKAGEPAQALEEVNRHLAANPRDPQGRFLKGIILSGLNRQDEAIAVFRKLTEDHPELPEPYNNLAVIYAQQKQYEKAKEALEKAIRTHPAYATAHENLGDIYTRLASQAYGKALQFDAANASAQTKLAMISDLVGSNGKPAAAPPVKPQAPIAVAKVDPRPAGPATAAPPATVPAKLPAAPPAVVPKTPETKSEPPKPAATATPAPSPVGRTPDTEIAAAVDGWLAAWSGKNVKAYLSHYAADFQLPGGKTRKAWENERTSRIDKPGKIEVGRDKLSITAEGPDKATVRFRQHYRSASFKSSSGKTLVLIRRDGRWLIQQERVGG